MNLRYVSFMIVFIRSCFHEIFKSKCRFFINNTKALIFLRHFKCWSYNVTEMLNIHNYQFLNICSDIPRKYGNAQSKYCRLVVNHYKNNERFCELALFVCVDPIHIDLILSIFFTIQICVFLYINISGFEKKELSLIDFTLRAFQS